MTGPVVQPSPKRDGVSVWLVTAICIGFVAILLPLAVVTWSATSKRDSLMAHRGDTSTRQSTPTDESTPSPSSEAPSSSPSESPHPSTSHDAHPSSTYSSTTAKTKTARPPATSASPYTAPEQQSVTPVPIDLVAACHWRDGRAVDWNHTDNPNGVKCVDASGNIVADFDQNKGPTLNDYCAYEGRRDFDPMMRQAIVRAGSPVTAVCRMP